MKTQTFITGVLIMLLSIIAEAQESASRFSFEASAGPSYSFGKLGGSDLKIGGGFEWLFHYDIMPHTGIYAGWGWNHFSADDSFINEKTGFEETGYIMGLQHKRPFPGESKMKYFVRAGALYNHLEVENEKGDIVGDTGHGWGWQFATGIEIHIRHDWYLTPGLKINSLSRTLNYEQTERNLDLNYVSLRIGFLKKF